MMAMESAEKRVEEEMTRRKSEACEKESGERKKRQKLKKV